MGTHTDLTGKKYGKLFVLGRGDDYISPSGSKLLRWSCQCECGKNINATTSQLKRGLSSCGCVSKREDLTGRKFGKLTVMYPANDYVSPSGSRMGKWHCKCECGNEVDVLGMSLKNGDTKTCGFCNRKVKYIKNPQKEYSGELFGDLLAINNIEGSHPPKYFCRCICGKELPVLRRDLLSGKKINCGCKSIKPNVPKISHKIQKMNYIGAVFGELTVLEELEPHITPNGSKQRIIKCKCTCGNEFVTRLESAKKTQKCRSCSVKARRTDITGKRFGKLVVISMADDYISPSGHRLSRCICKCDCGKLTTVNMSRLVTGSTRSCGCIHNVGGLLKDCPELVAKYDFVRNEQIGLDFNTIAARTPTKAWWKCIECGNSWYATIASQNDKIKHGCPYCSGRLVIKGKTDLLTQHPDIVNDWWDFEKNTVSPDEISSSSSQKIWWRCKEGHSWKATVANKVSGSGCPRCNLENVNSFCEQAVYYYIKQSFPDAINSDKHLGMELDIYIPSKRVAIEYDGEAWHNTKKKTKTDEEKNKVCANNNITMIRIREPRLSDIDNCLVFVRKDSTTSKSLDNVIEQVLKHLGAKYGNINTDSDSGNILGQYATKKYNNSLASCYPEIASEWHPTKNGLLTPDKVSKGARRKVWWLGKCGHEWVMAVSDRTRAPFTSKSGKVHNPQGCPFCSGKRILIGFNDLLSQYPDIAKEWHPTKNRDLKPTDVMPGSGKEIWWLGKCGHEWKSTPCKRCKDNDQCPICFKEKRSPSVICIETNQIFKSGIEAAQFAGLYGSGSIYKCCRGQQNQAGGYHWKYAGSV